MRRALARLAAATLALALGLALLSVGGVAASPLSAQAAQAHQVLDEAAEAQAHPLLVPRAAHAPTSTTGPEQPADLALLRAASKGSLRAVQRSQVRSRALSAQGRAKAAQFAEHVEALIDGLKHKDARGAARRHQRLNRTDEAHDAAHSIEVDEAEGADPSTQRFLQHLEQEQQREQERERALFEHEHEHAHEHESEQQHEQHAHDAAHAHIPAHLHHPRTDTDTLPRLQPVQAAQRATADGAGAGAGERLSSAPWVLHPVQVPATPGPAGSGLNFSTFVYPTAQGPVTVFVGVTEFPLGKFHFLPSPREADDQANLLSRRRHSAREHPVFLEMGASAGARLNPLCDGRAETSVSAQAYGCLLAQNAGFFDMGTGACLGNVVSNDQLINRASADMQRYVHFGLTRAGNFVAGYLTAEEVGAGVDGGFHELSQGHGWLVREGANYLNTSRRLEQLDPHFVTEKAPRNAVGHDSQGRLLMFEADGEEDIDLGLTLDEFADILSTHFDVVNAINVDGGGSSTTVYKGKVVDRPTCRDTPDLCERAVTTISCVMP